MDPLQWLATALIRGYQTLISPLLPPSCKYYPSCSAYALEAVRVQGFVRGTGLAVWRVLRCNPWSRGGVDFPPGSTMAVEIPPDEESEDMTNPEHAH